MDFSDNAVGNFRKMNVQINRNNDGDDDDDVINNINHMVVFFSKMFASVTCYNGYFSVDSKLFSGNSRLTIIFVFICSSSTTSTRNRTAVWCKRCDSEAEKIHKAHSSFFQLKYFTIVSTSSHLFFRLFSHKKK